MYMSYSTQPREARAIEGAGPHLAVKESGQSEIRRLYIENRKTLSELVSIMASKGFAATRKQYKHKLKEWGFAKNIRRQDAMRMISIRQLRSNQGKMTHLELNGKVVDLDKYTRRTALQMNEYTRFITPDELPQYLRPHTPPITVAAPLLSLGLIRATELVMAYYTCLPPSEATILPRVGSPYSEQIWGAAKAFENLYHASWLFSEAQSVPGGCLARRAFLELELYQNSSPQFLLVAMYASVMYPIDDGVLTELWRYLAARAAIIQGEDSMDYCLANALYNILQPGDQQIYHHLIPELMERIFDLETDRREVSTHYSMLASMSIQWPYRLERSQQLESLMQKCLYRGKEFVADEGAKQALERTQVSSDWRNLINGDPGHGRLVLVKG
ncbi:hypothetical protein SCUP234_13185 [Seiridium cupressi]